MNIIFLDVDGVLNSATSFRRDRPDTNTYTCEKMVKRFKEMMDRLPDVKIVVSSTWRMGFYDALIDILERGGVDRSRFIGKTPIPPPKFRDEDGLHSDSPRGAEIQAWLDHNPGVEKFVIIDDNADMAHLMPHLVKTTWELGLENKHVEEIIRRLS